MFNEIYCDPSQATNHIPRYYNFLVLFYSLHSMKSLIPLPDNGVTNVVGCS